MRVSIRVRCDDGAIVEFEPEESSPVAGRILGGYDPDGNLVCWMSRTTRIEVGDRVTISLSGA